MWVSVASSSVRFKSKVKRTQAEACATGFCVIYKKCLTHKLLLWYIPACRVVLFRCFLSGLSFSFFHSLFTAHFSVSFRLACWWHRHSCLRGFEFCAATDPPFTLVQDKPFTKPAKDGAATSKATSRTKSKANSKAKVKRTQAEACATGGLHACL